MLNADTKRRINAARDILVGKVPDPKAQVEQITTALIYKFMWDMDRQSEEIKGKPKFFVGDFKKFSWANLIDSRLAGQERLDLYVRAITSFSKNKDLPQLFRDIFKDSFLPFRDPETLSLFLKEIDGFTYGHSEDLGDAFEYLLLILGSQGDAGQFRTPRHIIDFIVEVVAPTVDDTVLDPACGTAGFLVSAYKHIRSQHDVGAHGIPWVGKPLTPAQRKKLMQNFVGYDISPDMVRIALVNLYLHGFPEPKIYEYDTLSSEERWGERFDVILANPPFMSPKGGIRPHKRFSVPANRAEVLFVDYIMEHLTPKGRAGIIVPEGIIFQSSGAYKQLRKLLVEDGLYAVVSLPSGVFNPYSGVKTSILFFDNQVARRTDDILFVKVEHDGYDLGAQRRETPDKNDLPEALRILQEYKENTLRHPGPGHGIHPATPAPPVTSVPTAPPVIASGAKQSRPTPLRHPGLRAGAQNLAPDTFCHPGPGPGIHPLVSLVPKSRIAESGDYNLTGDRYQSASASRGCELTGKWPTVKLGEVCAIVCGGTPSREKSEYWEGGNIKWLRAKYIQDDAITGYETITQKAVDKSAVSLVPPKSVVVVTRVSVGKIAYLSEPYAINQDITGLTPNDEGILDSRFLYWCAKGFAPKLANDAQGVGVRGVTKKYVEQLEIPLPPLEVQKEIAAELDGYQHIIHGAKEIIANWKPKIEVDPKWPRVRLGDQSLFRTESGGTPLSSKSEYWDGGINWVTLVDLPASDRISEIKATKRTISQSGLENSAAKVLPVGTVLVSSRATIGRIGIARIPTATNQGFKNIVVKDAARAIPEFVAEMLLELVPKMQSIATGGTFKEISMTSFRSLDIPFPPLETQRQIVAKIEGEKVAVESSTKLAGLYCMRINDVVENLNLG